MTQKTTRAPIRSPEAFTAAAELFYRHTDTLTRFRIPLSKADAVEDIVSVALGLLTTELGYSPCAIALIDEAGVMRIQGAAGLASPVRGLQTAAETEPRWLRHASEGADSALLAALGCAEDLFVIPLQSSASAIGHNSGNLAPGAFLGNLYVGSSDTAASLESLALLLRFAERIGADLGFARTGVKFSSEGAAACNVAPFESAASGHRERLRRIIERVGLPIVVTDSSGALLVSNNKARALFEYPAQTLPQRAGAARLNGDRLAAIISALPDKERSTQAEIELVDPESGRLLLMEIHSVEIAGLFGRASGVLSILHDLSSIRETERRRVQQQLFDSEKLAVIGLLSASIAHEINNPMEAIKNSLFLLRGDQNASGSRFLEIALKETERVSQIIGHILNFSRNSGEIEWINVNDILEEILVLVDKKMRLSGTRVIRELETDLPRMRACSDQLRQVFLNLLLNAQQSMAGHGTITVKTSALAGAAEPAVSMEITDTGTGISEDDLAHIFEPFFSTRKKGTGLGLWVTQDIVRRHGGRIEVRSVVNRGTTFRVILPLEPPESLQRPAGHDGTGEDAPLNDEQQPNRRLRVARRPR